MGIREMGIIPQTLGAGDGDLWNQDQGIKGAYIKRRQAILGLKPQEGEHRNGLSGGIVEHTKRDLESPKGIP